MKPSTYSIDVEDDHGEPHDVRARVWLDHDKDERGRDFLFVHSFEVASIDGRLPPYDGKDWWIGEALLHDSAILRAIESDMANEDELAMEPHGL